MMLNLSLFRYDVCVVKDNYDGFICKCDKGKNVFVHFFEIELYEKTLVRCIIVRQLVDYEIIFKLPSFRTKPSCILRKVAITYVFFL